jgi:hypothetical protein
VAATDRHGAVVAVAELLPHLIENRQRAARRRLPRWAQPRNQPVPYATVGLAPALPPRTLKLYAFAIELAMRLRGA